MSLGERQDIASQRRAVQEFAAKHEVVIARWWIDEHVSGSSVEGRDAFDRLLIEAKQNLGAVAGVLVWSYSRWARNDLESQYYRSWLRMHNYAFISVSDNIPGGDMSLLMEAFLEISNRKFLEQLSADTRRGLREAVLKEVEVDGQRLKGFSGGGFAPRGCRAKYIETGRRKDGSPRMNAIWEFDPEWKERVDRARQLFAAGEMTTRIHEECRLQDNLLLHHLLAQRHLRRRAPLRRRRR